MTGTTTHDGYMMKPIHVKKISWSR